MKHIELLNSDEVLDTFNYICENNDTCYVCDADCSCDTYVCVVEVCGIENPTCDTCNIAANIGCVDTCGLIDCG